MDLDEATARMIIHQQEAREVADHLREAANRGRARPSVKRVVELVDRKGSEVTAYEVARVLREVYRPRRKSVRREPDSKQLPLFGWAA